MAEKTPQSVPNSEKIKEWISRFQTQNFKPMEIELVTLSDLENLKKEILSEIRRLLSGKSNELSDKKWLKSKEVQKLLGISPGTLQTLRNRAMIPYTRLGGVIYYNQEEVKKVLEKPEAKPNLLHRKFR